MIDSVLESLPTIAGDASIVLIFLAASLALGFFFGRTKLLSIMIDVYVARALVAVIPSEWVASVVYSDVIIFSLVFVFLLLTDHKLFDIHLSNRGSDFFWRVGVMSILVVGMLTSTFLSFFPAEEALEVMSQTLYSYFASENANMFWMLTPLFVLSFINKRLRD
jgi:hypothetical protein